MFKGFVIKIKKNNKKRPNSNFRNLGLGCWLVFIPRADRGVDTACL